MPFQASKISNRVISLMTQITASERPIWYLENARKFTSKHLLLPKTSLVVTGTQKSSNILSVLKRDKKKPEKVCQTSFPNHIFSLLITISFFHFKCQHETVK